MAPLTPELRSCRGGRLADASHRLRVDPHVWEHEFMYDPDEDDDLNDDDVDEDEHAEDCPDC